MAREKRPGRSPGAVAGLVFFRQEEGGYAAVGLGDDPKAISAVALARLGGVNRVGRKDAKVSMGRKVVLGGVLGANNAPIAADMTAKAFHHAVVGNVFDSAACGNEITNAKWLVRDVLLCHDLYPFI
jgi:hypothetical protein